MLPSEKECRQIAETVLGSARVDDASVSIGFGHAANTRFANNEPTTSGESDTLTLSVSATKDGRTGRASLNETSPAALERAMRRAEELASLLPPDPEYVGPLPPQKYLAIPGEDATTASYGAAERVPGVKAVVDPAARDGLNSSGYFATEAGIACLANKAGNFGYHPFTTASFSATVRTADGTGSGWAEGTSHRVADLDPMRLAATALRKAKDSASPRAVEPGDYTVVLEPAAVAELVGFNFGMALSARAAEEGRSYFSKQGGGTRLGEKVLHETVTLRSDPLDPRRPGSPWGGGGFGGGGGEGLASAPITWIEKGVLKNLVYDRYWAKKAGREATPTAGNAVLEGGAETLDSLIASTERGLLITHFWYIRVVNPQTLQLTGLTRDGIWLIEKGKIAHPVMNLRFNESPAVLLNNVLGMTPAVRSGNAVVPGIKAANFTFSSLSDAI